MRKGLIVLSVAAATSLAAVAARLQNVTGTITDLDANPLPGIEVSLFDAVNAELLASATTDASGHYDSGGIPIGSYRVRLLDPSGAYGPEFYGAGGVEFFCDGAIVPVFASSATVLDAQMHPLEPIKIAGFEGPVGGTVVDAATGTPLQGIRVSILKNWNADVLATVITDADGFYSFGSEGAQIPRVRIRFSDPAGRFFPEFYGADADAFCSATSVSAGLKVAAVDGFLDRVPPEHMTQHLADTVQSYDLPGSVATMLGTSLTRLQGLLADDNDGNTAAGCGQLASFLSRVDVQERRGELSAAQANELRGLAANLRTALVCQ